MYQARQRGAGPSFYAAPGPPPRERLQLGRRLRQALEAGQLVTHLQPVVDVDSGRHRGYEALVR